MGLVVLSIILTVVAFLFVYVVITAAALIGYWWWNFRKLRKSLRQASNASTAQDSNVIEGELIQASSNMPTVLLGEVRKNQAILEESNGHYKSNPR